MEGFAHRQSTAGTRQTLVSGIQICTCSVFQNSASVRVFQQVLESLIGVSAVTEEETMGPLDSSDSSKEEQDISVRRKFKLSHEDRIEKLSAVRRTKAAKRAARKADRIALTLRSTLEQWIDGSDAIRARGMGIRLN